MFPGGIGIALRFTIQNFVRLAALKSEKTLAELAQQHDIHPNQITQWKTQLLERAATEPAVDITTLHAKIGALTLDEFYCDALPLPLAA